MKTYKGEELRTVEDFIRKVSAPTVKMITKPSLIPQHRAFHFRIEMQNGDVIKEFSGQGQHPGYPQGLDGVREGLWISTDPTRNKHRCKVAPGQKFIITTKKIETMCYRLGSEPYEVFIFGVPGQLCYIQPATDVPIPIHEGGKLSFIIANFHGALQYFPQLGAQCAAERWFRHFERYGAI